MSFGRFFKTKSQTDATISAGSVLPKQYKPSNLDLWAKVSGDGQNVVLHAYDGDNKAWRRSPKIIVSATDPASSASLITANAVQTNDVWVNTSGATSVWKVWTGTAWK